MADGFAPVKPAGRPARAGPLRRWRLARRNLFSALKDGLYRAWMAEVKAPFRNAYLINQPELVKTVLVDRAEDFPKDAAVGRTLRDLLGDSVFVTNGALWERQRRMIDPAFAAGRLREVLPSMLDAATAMAARLAPLADGRAVEMERATAHAAADVIFRALFSRVIPAETAGTVFDAFRRYQAAAPVMSPLDIIGAPAWIPRPGRRRTRAEGRAIRAALRGPVADRAAEIAAGTAPDDLATRIMTAPDPATGRPFGPEEMLDQVAIFFLAGHETSASSLAWALYLLAGAPEAQARARAEAETFVPRPDFKALRRLDYTRCVYREALRLYPPVPVLVRTAGHAVRFRNRHIAKSSLVFISPWHLHRHERLWRAPDAFDPARWARAEEAESRRTAYLPFSAGPRVCPGAGFAMMEGVVLLAKLLASFDFQPAEHPPAPMTQLTLRSATGVWLKVTRRPQAAAV